MPADARRFLESHRFAVIGTTNPDGSPQQALVWYLVERDEAGLRIVVNSREGRRWPSNLRRDPRISFAVQDGLDWVGLNGTVSIQDDQPTAQHDIATMARLNDPPDQARRAIREFEAQQRVSFRFRPASFHVEITAVQHQDDEPWAGEQTTEGG
jgi:PPOX class probable F420-dependent enzyme